MLQKERIYLLKKIRHEELYTWAQGKIRFKINIISNEILISKEFDVCSCLLKTRIYIFFEIHSEFLTKK
jgi:hypothetical protein